MSARRTVLGGIAAWVVVVALGSALVWGVIGRVGQHLDPSNEALGAPAVPSGTGTSTAGTARHSGHASQPAHPGGPRSGAQEEPSSRPTTGGEATQQTVPTTPSSRPSDSPEPGPQSGAPHPSGAHTHAASQSSPASTEPIRATWEGRPGVVTAECRGRTVRLIAAQPDSGYSVELEESGPERLVVDFEGRSDGAEGHVSVLASCVRGEPAFDTSSSDDDRRSDSRPRPTP